MEQSTIYNSQVNTLLNQRENPMNIIISNSGDTPIYEQISTQIKNLIICGELNEGDSLPSMRTLAKELRISVITTKRAYEELERDGFIESFTGRGSFVLKQNKNILVEEKLKEIETSFLNAIQISNTLKLSYEELSDILKTLYKGE